MCRRPASLAADPRLPAATWLDPGSHPPSSRRDTPPPWPSPPARPSTACCAPGGWVGGRARQAHRQRVGPQTAGRGWHGQQPARRTALLPFFATLTPTPCPAPLWHAHCGLGHALRQAAALAALAACGARHRRAELLERGGHAHLRCGKKQRGGRGARLGKGRSRVSAGSATWMRLPHARQPVLRPAAANN